MSRFGFASEAGPARPVCSSILRLTIRYYQPEQLHEVAPGSGHVLGNGCQFPVHINAGKRQNGCKRENGQEHPRPDATSAFWL